MKRKIELPTFNDLKRKAISDEHFLNPIEALVDECSHLNIRDIIQYALQQAYNQGYEDATPKWLPIDSAPKDGTLIDLLVNGKRLTNMKWNVTSPKFPNGYWSIDQEFNWSYADLLEPTHWMPLPEIGE